MSDFKLFCEVNKEIDTELISELYSDTKCLLKSYLLNLIILFLEIGI